MDRTRFFALLAAVSAAAALAAIALIEGVNDGRPELLVAAAIAGFIALLGMLALGRIVFVIEQRRGPR